MTSIGCPSCGGVNDVGRKFCGECGDALVRICPTCGSANVPAVKFCGECGHAFAARSVPPSAVEATPQAERRLVTVLFADLVGFTSLAEHRDFEDVRELQSRYFEAARTTIERHGGTVEKFIGDAVMALWGAPVAHEDDAERAVRAALELVAAVPALDPQLQARAGVLTGEAAVTLDTRGEGMVAGDLVNTASRVQSTAEAGTVVVGEATHRASNTSIAYEDRGLRELKGKSEAVRVWQALRVVAGRRGHGRSGGFEAPFVGRERELRLVKELFHATADEGRAHLLSVVGVAGIGKSRLAWEFEKYIDGLTGEAWWHRGRCLAYGEGVSYWALAEIIRMRARIAEDEPAEDALRKLGAVVGQIVADPDERAFVEPRLQHLLGLTDRVAPNREDLFSGWRLFVERMAEQHPVLMVFEDIQWADGALLEFVEYLLEWSRSYPIYLVMLARPEVSERHPGWGGGLRNSTMISLEPLSQTAMDELLRGLVPGLPEELTTRIRERADGVPLYAVETVRMLLDRGLLEPGEGGYRALGDLSSLDVPETLQALVAARLDGLDPAERRLLQDASVLGKTFAPRGVAALGETDEEGVLRGLDSLVRKELLALDTDPRSPERGQYGFVQALVQRIAYDMLSRRERKAKHLAAARYLTGAAGIDPDEIAEVIAMHFLDAYRAAPGHDDAPAIKADARSWLVRAGERSTALAATEEALHSFEEAIELTEEPRERARLSELAGGLARAADRLDDAEAHFQAAFAFYDQTGATHDRARVAAALGVNLWRRGVIDEALGVLEGAFAVLAGDEPDADVAALAAELGRLHFFAGDRATAAERIETALDIAEELVLPGVLASALNTKSLFMEHHPHEGEALLRQALRIALDHDLDHEALRAYNNLLFWLENNDRVDEMAALVDEALAVARRRGDLFWETRMALMLFEDLRLRGQWDEAIERAEALRLKDEEQGDVILLGAVGGLARIHIDRGALEAARALLEHLPVDIETADYQRRGLARLRRQLEAELDGGELSDAINATLETCLEVNAAGTIAEALRDAADAAVLTGDHSNARRACALLDQQPGTKRTRSVDSQLHRLRANAAAAEGNEADAADAFALALANARNLGFAFYLAPVLRDYGAWLDESGRAEEAAPLLAEARELFARMGAVTWIERIDALAPVGADV